MNELNSDSVQITTACVQLTSIYCNNYKFCKKKWLYFVVRASRI